MKTCALVIYCFAVVATSGCGNSDSTGPEKSLNRIPDFRIVALQNTSTKKERRFQLKIVLPSHYTETSVKSTLPIIANTIKEPESEITMLFYGPHSSLRDPFDIARAIWKNGDVIEINYKPAITGHKND